MQPTTTLFSEVSSSPSVPASVSQAEKLLDEVSLINDFRNNWIAHQSDKLSDKDMAQQELARWIEGLALISGYGKDSR